MWQKRFILMGLLVLGGLVATAYATEIEIITGLLTASIGPTKLVQAENVARPLIKQQVTAATARRGALAGTGLRLESGRKPIFWIGNSMPKLAGPVIIARACNCSTITIILSIAKTFLCSAFWIATRGPRPDLRRSRTGGASVRDHPRGAGLHGPCTAGELKAARPSLMDRRNLLLAAVALLDLRRSPRRRCASGGPHAAGRSDQPVLPRQCRDDLVRARS